MTDVSSPRPSSRHRSPSFASSTFHPHRPPPIPAYDLSLLPSTTSIPYSPPYASYVRPRRSSLSTKSSNPSPISPTAETSSSSSPTFPRSLIASTTIPGSVVPPPPLSHRSRHPPLSSSSIRALRRRDIKHPSTTFRGATVIGRSASQSSGSAVSTLGGEENEGDYTGVSTSVDTTATSVFLDEGELSKTRDLSLSVKRNSKEMVETSPTSIRSPLSRYSQNVDEGGEDAPFHLEEYLGEEGGRQGQGQMSTFFESGLQDGATDISVTVSSQSSASRPTIAEETNDDSSELPFWSVPSSFSEKSRSIRRIFNPWKPPEPVLNHTKSLGRLRPSLPPSTSKNKRHETKASIERRRPRSNSLPPMSPCLSHDEEEDTVDTILRIGGYDDDEEDAFAPSRPRLMRPTAPLFSHSSPDMRCDHHRLLVEEEEATEEQSAEPEEQVKELQEVVDEEEQSRRVSVISASSDTSSAAPYRSLFGVFELEVPPSPIDIPPRADSCTLPDLPTLLFPRPVHSSSFSPLSSSGQSARYSTSTFETSFSSNNPLVPPRRRLLGPRPPSTIYSSSLFSSSERRSLASTVFSRIDTFPFPPELSSPTPPIPDFLSRRLPLPTTPLANSIGSRNAPTIALISPTVSTFSLASDDRPANDEARPSSSNVEVPVASSSRRL